MRKTFSILLALVLILSLSAGFAPAQAGSADVLPRPGEFLLSGRTGAHGVSAGRVSVPQRGVFHLEHAFIHLVPASYAREMTGVFQLVLHGGAELIDAVITFANGVRFYGVRDYFADGEVVTITVANPPANTASEIYFSWRLTRSGDGATSAYFFNRELNVVTRHHSWTTGASPHTRARPVGTGAITGFIDADFLSYDADADHPYVLRTILPDIPLPRAGSVPTDPPAASRIVRVILDGELMAFDVPPQIINNRTMVPLRAIFEALGAEVDWDSGTRTVTGTKGDTVIVLVIGSTAPTVNGQVVTIDQPGVIVGGRTLVPLRFVAESLGVTVDWDGEARIVTITS